MEVFETPLPGVGSRYEFTTQAGDRLAIVARRDRRRDLVLYDDADPDACRATIELTGEESSVVVELLGGTKLTERLSDLRHEVEGLAIEWVTMPDAGGLTGRTIGDGTIRTATGASVVAVIRSGASIPGPGPDFRFSAGDIVLVIGSTAAVQAAATTLAG
ncbi:MAG: cation:proton antiporter regulatory subunit [Acidimicrobiales bacterium]|nr:cation:proton antiporter regulatory subunit [Acidimicrobiales bacterium]